MVHCVVVIIIFITVYTGGGERYNILCVSAVKFVKLKSNKSPEQTQLYCARVPHKKVHNLILLLLLLLLLRYYTYIIYYCIIFGAYNETQPQCVLILLYLKQERPPLNQFFNTLARRFDNIYTQYYASCTTSVPFTEQVRRSRPENSCYCFCELYPPHPLHKAFGLYEGL